MTPTDVAGPVIAVVLILDRVIKLIKIKTANGKPPPPPPAPCHKCAETLGPILNSVSTNLIRSGDAWGEFRAQVSKDHDKHEEAIDETRIAVTETQSALILAITQLPEKIGVVMDRVWNGRGKK